MRQDESMNSNFQQSNRHLSSRYIKWHLKREEYLCNAFVFYLQTFSLGVIQGHESQFCLSGCAVSCWVWLGILYQTWLR